MTAVAVRPPSAVVIRTDDQLRDFLTDRQAEFAVIAKASGVEAAVLVAELVAAARKNPQILECTPESIVTFMYDSAKTGLIIGRGCFAVPVRKKGVPQLECWIGAHGMRELVKYSGGARDVFAQIVYDGDPFEEILGLYPDVKHTKGPHYGDMAHAVGVYGVLVIAQNIRRHVYLSKAVIERLRQMNRSDTTSSSSPWVAHERAMWEAKAVLAACKTAPRNPRLAHAMSVFDKNEDVRIDEIETVQAEVIATTSVTTPAVGAPADTGEAATEKQVALIKQLASSHHFDEKAKATMRRRADAATKAQAADLIDGATGYIKRMDAREREDKKQADAIAGGANPKDGLPGADDDLPF